MTQAAPPGVLVLTGAPGAGKTTLVRRLAALGLPGVGCYALDDTGIPSAAGIAARGTRACAGRANSRSSPAPR